MSITMGTVFAITGAGLAICVTGISSAVGLKAGGTAAAGAVAEKKENFVNSMVLQALPQTQTIYGFIIALFILIGAGLTGGGIKALTTEQGLALFGAGAIVALTGISAIFQGQVAAAGIVSTAKNKEAFAPSIVFSGQVETPAIFGFVISLILLIMGLGVFG